jgi:hypothetical protein
MEIKSTSVDEFTPYQSIVQIPLAGAASGFFVIFSKQD